MAADSAAGSRSLPSAPETSPEFDFQAINRRLSDPGYIPSRASRASVRPGLRVPLSRRGGLSAVVHALRSQSG
jgi:hypothetical protein